LTRRAGKNLLMVTHSPEVDGPAGRLYAAPDASPRRPTGRPAAPRAAPSPRRTVCACTYAVPGSTMADM
ncbi:MAG: hypothetical protein SNJ69_18680, partial [Chloroflexaceae bacterium]